MTAKKPQFLKGQMVMLHNGNIVVINRHLAGGQARVTSETGEKFTIKLSAVRSVIDRSKPLPGSQAALRREREAKVGSLKAQRSIIDAKIAVLESTKINDTVRATLMKVLDGLDEITIGVLDDVLKGVMS